MTRRVPLEVLQRVAMKRPNFNRRLDRRSRWRIWGSVEGLHLIVDDVVAE